MATQFGIVATSAALVAILRRRKRAKGGQRSTMPSGDSIAFFFTKPHAVNEKVDEMVRSVLSEHDIHVLKEGTIDGSNAMASIIDAHYGTLAERAMKASPQSLPPIPGKALASLEKLGTCRGMMRSQREA